MHESISVTRQPVVSGELVQDFSKCFFFFYNGVFTGLRWRTYAEGSASPSLRCLNDFLMEKKS